MEEVREPGPRLPPDAPCPNTSATKLNRSTHFPSMSSGNVNAILLIIDVAMTVQILRIAWGLGLLLKFNVCVDFSSSMFLNIFNPTYFFFNVQY